ncbi:MAG: hypothetical protein ACOC0N_10710 [Chroococcales cyanobacterium]
MTPTGLEAIAIAKLKEATLKESNFERQLDNSGKTVLLITAPDFSIARAIWKNRQRLEKAILGLGLAEYWQIKVDNCPYTPKQRILTDSAILCQLKASFPDSSSLKAASQFCQFSRLKNRLIVHAEHPGIAHILASQECLFQLADCAKKVGLERLSLTASMPGTQKELIVIKDVFLTQLKVK